MGYCVVFDTETTSLDKPFCYDVGYAIMDMDTGDLALTRHYIVEQVWHNLPLFESAYYKEKRPLYIALMRKRAATMDKWGYIMQAMIRDFKAYNITDAYAYNSTFDEKVFNWNCDWFKTANPFDNVAIHDIWGYASEYITNTAAYRAFAEENTLFTDTGNYKGSAESVYQYISDQVDFSEAHMGLYDTLIEAKILYYCVDMGAKWATDYTVQKVLKRPIKKPFIVKVNNKIVYQGEYIKKYARNDVYNFTE